ncbi:protein of unknown function [Pseudomonas sp. JV241A]|nr:protein of unknown function [Pseudomonas sp. JV241A]
MISLLSGVRCVTRLQEQIPYQNSRSSVFIFNLLIFMGFAGFAKHRQSIFLFGIPNIVYKRCSVFRLFLG